MKKKYEIWILILACFLVSILSHAFFIGEWFNGTYMIGPNDGLSQMVPFREMLYDHYSNGDFFYSYEYGLGGGTFSQLAYYYATNLVFWLTCIVVFILESLHIITDPDVLFWAQATLIISIVRLSAVIFLATKAFRYLQVSLVPAFTGAVLYGATVMYFRHNAYWEFFSDAFLWLPVLFLGIEKVIREGKPGWLIAAVAISAFDNFYFAFIHCIFAIMYIFFRWLLPLTDTDINRLQQIKLFLVSAALGVGIGAFSFVPAVYGFLNNFRPPYDDPIPLWDFRDNILLDSYRFILPAIFVLLIFVFPLYKNRTFRLFTLFAFTIIIMHYSPIMWSFFNGMSAPQQRFEYLGSFAIGAAVAVGLSKWHLIKRKYFFVSSGCAILLYLFFYLRDETYSFAELEQSLIAVSALVIILVYMALSNLSNHQAVWLLSVTIIVANSAVLYQFQEEKIYKAGNVEESTKDYILSDEYYSKEQRELIQEVLQEDEQPLARMEWKTDGRNNTPIIQGFTGTSVYSSVLNQNLLFFYYHDLEIDMKRESVSRYAGFGDRANLHSLFAGKYVMRNKENISPVPYGFVRTAESTNYVVYQNTNALPFVKASSNIFSEQALADKEMLAREHAMLDGVVLEGYTGEEATPPETSNIVNEIEIEEAGSTYEEGLLIVEEETGGLDLNINDGEGTTGDFYVSFDLDHAQGMKEGFPLHVNEFRTTRKPAESIYRTEVNKLTIRVAQADTISIRMPQGSYRLENIRVFREDYQALEYAVANFENNAAVDINGSRISIEYDNVDSNRYLTIPVPYEKGWQVHVNGERKKVENANYAFLGTEIQPGKNEIEFVYYPPYFKLTLFISLLSIITAICWLKWKKRKEKR